jgi:hypothetical protein
MSSSSRDRCHPQLCEPRRLGPGERLVTELGVRVTAPQRQRTVEHAGCGSGVGVQTRTRLIDQPDEQRGIKRVSVEREHIAGRLGVQGQRVVVARRPRPQASAEPRYEVVQGARRVRRWFVAPDDVGELVSGHDRIGLHDQRSQQPAELG